MNRRLVFALLGGLVAWSLALPLAPRHPVSAAAIDRLSKWMPQPTLLVDWRYAAGHVVDGGRDYGFVISMTDMKPPVDKQSLLVQRQDFDGARAFASTTYSGTLSYDSGSATYTFRNIHNQTLAAWQLVQATQLYSLTVAAPELSLQAVLRPQGTLIPEGGDGAIDVGHSNGVHVLSDYYADWTAIEIGGVAKGTARVDMQGLRPATLASAQIWGRFGGAQPFQEPRSTRLVGRVEKTFGEATPPQTSPPCAPCSLKRISSSITAAGGDDYDHHWFVVAGKLDGQPVWISAWRIEDESGPLWDVTIARGSGSWQVASYTEGDAAAAPLAVIPRAWQPLPAGSRQHGPTTGSAWRLTAGLGQPGDLLALDVAVPPGQFTVDSRLAIGGLSAMEEGVGTTAAGTVLGRPLTDVSLVVAESTAEFYLQFLPLALA